MSAPDDTSSVAGYAHGHQPSVLASHASRTAANSCAYVLDRLAPGARVLDLGCGPGSITLDLAARVGPRGRVLGVDYSAEAIDAARAEAARRGDEMTRFRVGDALDLDVEPGSFDIVHAHQVLQHVVDPVAALRAMSRYCAPGGVIAVREADYGAMAWYPPEAGLDRWREVYCASARALGGEPDAGRRLRAWAREAGLALDVVSTSTWTYATAETTLWWGESQADRVRTSSFASRAADLGVTHAEITSMVAAWEHWARSPDAWFLVPHGEIVARGHDR